MRHQLGRYIVKCVDLCSIRYRSFLDPLRPVDHITQAGNICAGGSAVQSVYLLDRMTFIQKIIKNKQTAMLFVFHNDRPLFMCA